jgi:hypothetical protein
MKPASLMKISLNASPIHLWVLYIGDIRKQNCQQQQHVTVLALATLGNVRPR